MAVKFVQHKAATRAHLYNEATNEFNEKHAFIPFSCAAKVSM
jgi:hypothetical protein